MPGRQCYHCKQWIEEGQPHDCWTTTEAALTADLSEDLRDAWERLRETAASFGEQRIYASHKSIMFSRDSCYFFVRPKRSFLELCVFLGRSLKAPQVRRADRSSKSKFYHIIQIRHRDEVESPLTDWLREAYEFSAAPPATSAPTRAKPKRKKPKPTKSGAAMRTDLLRFNGAVERDPAIDAWMKKTKKHSAELGAIAHHWFQVMRKCGDEVRELLHDGCPTACLGDAPFAYVNVFRSHVNVGFFHGAALPDPARLLQGTGKFMRHVKLKPGTPTNAAALTTLIDTAYSDIKSRVEHG